MEKISDARKEYLELKIVYLEEKLRLFTKVHDAMKALAEYLDEENERNYG